MKVNIIGAGIGGLTTAIALKKKNIDSQIFEQAKEIKPVGAGIILANNAMQIFDKLGLRKEIASSGNPISSMNITDRQLRPISKINLRHFERKYGVKNIAIHRGKLQQILASKLEGKLKLNHKLKNVTNSNELYHLEFENQLNSTTSNIIGADGINSVIRNVIFNEGEIRDSHQLCWRGVANYSLPKEFSNELNEAWGLGNRIGFVKIDDYKVYWYALISSRHNVELSNEELRYQFANYHPVVGELIQQTPSKSIHKAKIEDLKPIRSWCKENVCLIGDAAHATTPNLGQGACQAIEDAYYLGLLFDKMDVASSFKKFEQLRLSKAKEIVNTSWRIGKIAHWKNPFAVKFRNSLMKLTPAKMSLRQSERIFKLA